MLNKGHIFEVLRRNNQKPYYINKEETLLETRSSGIYYILSYAGNGRIGWSLTSDRINEIKHYQKHCIIFVNSVDGEMYMILEGNLNDFISNLSNNGKTDRVDKHDVEMYNITMENFEDYIRGL